MYRIISDRSDEIVIEFEDSLNLENSFKNMMRVCGCTLSREVGEGIFQQLCICGSSIFDVVRNYNKKLVRIRKLIK